MYSSMVLNSGGLSTLAPPQPESEGDQDPTGSLPLHESVICACMSGSLDNTKLHPRQVQAAVIKPDVMYNALIY